MPSHLVGEVGQQVVAGGGLAGTHHPANQPGVDKRAQPNAARDLVHFAADEGKQRQVDEHCPSGDECNGRCIGHAGAAVSQVAAAVAPQCHGVNANRGDTHLQQGVGALFHVGHAAGVDKDRGDDKGGQNDDAIAQAQHPVLRQHVLDAGIPEAHVLMEEVLHDRSHDVTIHDQAGGKAKVAQDFLERDGDVEFFDHVAALTFFGEKSEHHQNDQRQACNDPHEHQVDVCGKVKRKQVFDPLALKPKHRAFFGYDVFGDHRNEHQRCRGRPEHFSLAACKRLAGLHAQF